MKIRKPIASVSYANLRGTPRRLAYTLRSFAGAVWKLLKFLGLGDSNHHSAAHSFGFDVAPIAERAHPALERPRVKSCLLFDLVVADRLAPQDKAK